MTEKITDKLVKKAMRGNPDAGEKIILPDVYATYNRDTDTIFVFVCDAVEYLDKLKGYYRSEDYPAKREDICPVSERTCTVWNRGQFSGVIN